MSVYVCVCVFHLIVDVEKWRFWLQAFFIQIKALYS